MLNEKSRLQQLAEPLSRKTDEGVEPATLQSPKIVVVSSGKGGVGKSNVAVNLSIVLSQAGYRIMLVDADFGLANVDLLLGLTPKHTLQQVFRGKKELTDIILTGPGGVKIVPSSSGGKALGDFTFEQKKKMLARIRRLKSPTDIVFIDTGAGLSDNTLHFLHLADEAMLITTPEPTSIMDSYGIIKALAREKESCIVKLVVNMAEDHYDAQHVVSTIELISKQFFNVSMEEMGYIPLDPHVPKAVRQQRPYVELFPNSRATKGVQKIASRFTEHQIEFAGDGGVRGMLNRIAAFFS